MINNIIDHINACILLNTNSFEIALARCYSLKKIESIIDEVKVLGLNPNKYRNLINVQVEMFKNTEFINYLLNEEVSGIFWENFLVFLHKNSLDITNFKLMNLIPIATHYTLHGLVNSFFDDNLRIYLNKLNNRDITEVTLTQIILTNIKCFLRYFDDAKEYIEYVMTSKEYSVFEHSFVKKYFNYNTELHTIKNFIRILSENECLTRLLENIFTTYEIVIPISSVTELHNNKEYLLKLNNIFSTENCNFNKDNDNTNTFLPMWIDRGCNMDELLHTDFVDECVES